MVWLAVAISQLGIGFAAAQAPAQAPVLGGFDVYGSERIDVAALRIELRSTLEAFLAAAVGGNEAAIEVAVDTIQAAIEPYGPFASTSFSMTQDFYSNPGFYLTVDVVDAGDAERRMPFRELDPDTAGDFEDPDGLIADWYVYQDRFFALLASGALSSVDEVSCPALHCLAPFDHAELAPYLPRFDAGASAHESTLRAIVERDRDPRQRAAAVFLLAHTKDPGRLLPLLEWAMVDPDSTVRNNAMRIMIFLAQSHPDLDYPIESLIAAMDFAAASDRNKSAETVAMLAEQPRYRDIIRANALETCLKLLRLELPNNRNPAHRILMMVSGLSLPAEDIAGWDRWVREASESDRSAAPDDDPPRQRNQAE